MTSDSNREDDMIPPDEVASRAQVSSQKEEELDPRAALEAMLIREFDKAFYLSQFPDGYVSLMHPLNHYLSSGWREGKNPNRYFDTKYYLEQNPDVRFSNIHPFVHYLLFGINERRKPSAAGPKARVSSGPVSLVEPAEAASVPSEEGKTYREIKDAIRDSFDARWYERKYPDVAFSGQSPLDHYIQRGWREGRDPAPWFSTRHYLASNEDVAGAGINPFFHYVVQGRREGRSPCHPGGAKAEILRNLQSMPERIASWTYGKTVAPAAAERLTEALTKALSSPVLVASVSHDVYFENVGGIQTCIGREQAVFSDRRVHYLHLSPALPIPDLADSLDLNYAITVAVDGAKIGSFNPDQLMQVLSRLVADGVACMAFVVHHLMGHKTDVMKQLWEALGEPTAYFWVHDYFSACKGYTLLRNDVSYCGAPEATSNACSICVYGEQRAHHLANIRKLFETIPFFVVSPSAFALSLWSKVTDLPAVGSAILEHCAVKRARTPRKVKALPALQHPGADRAPLRVAFAGHATFHKGWDVFSRLVNELHGDDRYQFFHLGARPADDGLDVTYVEVSNTTARMKETLVEREIDLVVLWSVWPETYNIVAYECLSAGVQIVTNPIAGNVPAMVKKRRCGFVLEDEDALLEGFRNGLLWESVRGEKAPTRSARNFVFSDMTGSLIDREGFP